MSGDGSTDIGIPSVFMQKKDAELLRELLKGEEGVHVLLTWIRSDPDEGEEGDGGDAGEKEEESQGPTERISREVEDSSREGGVVADADSGSRLSSCDGSDSSVCDDSSLFGGSASNSDHSAPDRT